MHVAQRLGERAANATANCELSCVKRMFRLGLRARRVTRLPEVLMLKENNTRKGLFEPEPFQAVVANLPGDLRPLVGLRSGHGDSGE